VSRTLTCRSLLPDVGRPISALALGTAFYRFEDRTRCFEILDAFARFGGTLIDSGRLYGDSEKVIGEWMAARRVRDRMVVITKCGHGADGILPADGFEDMVTEELATSLESLQTDYVDLYMLHRDNPSMPVGRIMDRLNLALDRGRVRALGASNWEYARVDAANDYADKHGLAGFAAVSNHLSLAIPTGPFYPGLVATDPAGERWHEQRGTPLIAWSSQARGFFSGRFTAEMRDRPRDDQDDFTRRMLEIYCADDNLERRRRATEIGGREGGTSAVQVALAWLLHKPFPLVPIVGPHSVDELASCIDATSLRLTEAEVKWLNLQV